MDDRSSTFNEQRVRLMVVFTFPNDKYLINEQCNGGEGGTIINRRVIMGRHSFEEK